MAARSEASQKPVPIDGTLLEALADWSRRTLYRESDDWIFASPVMDGRQPLHGFCSFVFPRHGAASVRMCFLCKEARVTAQSTAQFPDSLKIIVATCRRHSGWRQSALKIFLQYLLRLDDAESFYLSKVAVIERCHLAAALQSCCSDD